VRFLYKEGGVPECVITRRILAIIFAAMVIQIGFVPQATHDDEQVSRSCPRGDSPASPTSFAGGYPTDYGRDPWQNIVPDLVVPVDQPSIQDAVNLACTGDVVMVLSGTYVESVTIATPMYLIGASIDRLNYTIGLNVSTTSLPLIVSTFGPTISITADNVTIDSFFIEGGGIELNGVKGSLLTRNVIAPWSGPGILLTAAEENRVQTNDIIGGPYGIRLEAKSKDNRIGPDNIIIGSDTGIWIGDLSGSNEVYQNDATNGSVGLQVERSSDNRIHHNTFDARDYCVQHRETDFEFISRNVMEGEGFGLVVTDSSSFRISSNQISTKDDSMLLEDAGKMQISGNSVRSENGIGVNILSAGSLPISIEDNALSGDTAGLRAKDVPDLRVEGNSFGGGQVGLEISGRSPFINGNTFWGQSDSSLRLSDTDGAVISDNVMEMGSLWALDLRSSSNAVVADNVIRGSARGFLLTDVAFPEINNNSFKDTDLALRLDNTPGAIVTENTFDLNDVGLDVQTNGAHIYHNWFLRNAVQISQGTPSFQNTWHDGTGHGNFWLDYDGEDLDYDAVGDTLIPHNGVDQYPITKRSFQAYLTFVGLVEELRNLINDPTLPKGIRNSLLVKLDHAQRDLIRKDNPHSARGSLTAFENEVAAQLGKKIPPGMANEIRQRTIDIFVAINDTDSDSDGLPLFREEATGLSYASPDTDNDFMSDSCEVEYSLNPRDGSDWSGDPDGDILTNYEECLLGTHPRRKDTDGDSFKVNFYDWREFSYWVAEGEMDWLLYERIRTHRVDPFDEGALTVAEWVQIARISSLLNNDDEDGDGYVGGWEANAVGFDPLNDCNGLLCQSPRLDNEEDGIINWREYDTWRAGFDTDPDVQDVIVEVDWMRGYDPRTDVQMFLGGDPDSGANWAPGGNIFPDILEPGVYAYFQEGMNLVLFYDEELPLAADGANNKMNRDEANDVYDFYFDGRDDDSVHGGISRYGVIVDQINIGGCGCSGIASSSPTDFFLVAFGAVNSTGVPYVDTIRKRSATFIHELGHALGLDHGGNHGTNRKPNYNSVMNYRFQLPGVDQSDPPDYDCNDPEDDVVDYSHGLNPPMDEGPYDGLASTELNAKCSGAAAPDGWLGEPGFGIHIMFCWAFGMWCAGDTNLYDFDDWGYIQSHVDRGIRHRDM
jgi:nitrous oxidase accessory protein NosD